MEELSYKRKAPYIVSFVAACSDSGKTTLIEKLIPLLKGKGYRVGALKHSAHKVEMDKEGKDSFRFSRAGADQVVVASKETLGMTCTLHQEPELKRILRLFENVDIILIEGYKHNEYPKIEIHRKQMDSRLLYNSSDYPGILAVASDEKLTVDCEVLDINNAEGIAGWIAQKAEEYLK